MQKLTGAKEAYEMCVEARPKNPTAEPAEKLREVLRLCDRSIELLEQAMQNAEVAELLAEQGSENTVVSTVDMSRKEIQLALDEVTAERYLYRELLNEPVERAPAKAKPRSQSKESSFSFLEAADSPPAKEHARAFSRPEVEICTFDTYQTFGLVEKARLLQNWVPTTKNESLFVLFRELVPLGAVELYVAFPPRERETHMLVQGFRWNGERAPTAPSAAPQSRAKYLALCKRSPDLTGMLVVVYSDGSRLTELVQ